MDINYVLCLASYYLTTTFDNYIPRWQLVCCNVSLRPDSHAGRKSGQIPIRFWCCKLSSRVPNEVGMNINWSETKDFCWSATLYKQHAKKDNHMPHLSLILGVLDMSQWRKFDWTLSARESLAHETTATWPDPSSLCEECGYTLHIICAVAVQWNLPQVLTGICCI